MPSNYEANPLKIKAPLFQPVVQRIINNNKRPNVTLFIQQWAVGWMDGRVSEEEGETHTALANRKCVEPNAAFL